MKNVIPLTGNPTEDRPLFRQYWKEPDTVFVLRSDEMLYEYIDKMKLNNRVLLQVRICKELSGLDVDYYEMEDACADSVQKINPENSRHAKTLSELLGYIDPAKSSYVTVNGDVGADADTSKSVRTQLGEIVQQLVYLQLPLNKIRVRTQREMKTAEVVRVFEQNIGKLQREIQQAIETMEVNRDAFTNRQLWADTAASLSRISQCLRESTKDELKISVAGTKKAGKSVIVNSMIEQELAPTSREKVTPNNCVYIRREDQYSLQSEGGGFIGFGAGREGASRLHDELTREFDKAQKSEGITIPDMNIGYMLDKTGITSYVITDTPGPDRAGHKGAVDIARKAIENADMAIYAIDYEKHLTDSEYEYLKWIVDEFTNKGKYYSLIFDVNKMDTRYQDEGQKSVPRSLDFIRQELIKIDSRFKSCILFGTSAQTYFNALAAPQIPGCEALGNEHAEKPFSELLEELFDQFDQFEESDIFERNDSDPKTILNFLSEITRRLRLFHGVEAQSLEDLKDFSGMKSLLSYVDYVAQEKARIEKLHSLMRKIDYEYANIINLFHFQELADALSRNRDRAAEVQNVLEAFAEEIEQIFDKDFPEVLRLCRAGEIKSDWIREYGQKTPFRWSEVRDRVIRDLTDSVNIEIRVNDLAENELPNYLRAHFKAMQEKAGFGRQKKIHGQTEFLLGAKEIEECYQRAVRQSVSQLPRAIEEKLEDAYRRLKRNREPTAKDIEGIFQTRQNRLEERVSYYSRLIWEDYSIRFDLETPAFTFDLTDEGLPDIDAKITADIRKLKFMRQVLQESLQNAPLRGKSGNIFSQLLSIVTLLGTPEEKIPPMYYNADAFIARYHKDIKPFFVAGLLAQHFEEKYRENVDSAVKVRRDYFDAIEKQMRDEEQRTEQYVTYAKRALDITGELDRKNQELEKKRQDLEKIQKAVSGFQGWWGKIRPDS